MTDHRLPIVILAGSPPEKDILRNYAGVDYKSLIDIHGKSMLTHILEGIHNSDMASYILVTGIPREIVDLPEGMDEDRIDFYGTSLSHVDKIVESAKYMLNKAEDDSSIFPAGTTHAIIMTSDVPAIHANTIRRFLLNCGDRSASLYYPVVHQTIMDKRFPDNGRSWIKVDGENYCGGDINLVELKEVEPLYPLIKKIVDNRKSFVKALFWASPITFFKFIFKRVGMKDVERLMTKIFGVKAKLIISEDAEVAFDVDKPFQLDLMRKHFLNRELM
ncbi:MAG: hypothetical protein ACXAD7_05555 [Candidatus Kariarchaeaceae archaeon]|jgi:hypothetical protein